MQSYDVETTGLDSWHGCRPFFAGVYDGNERNEVKYWEWEVDPYTREVNIPLADARELTETLEQDEMVCHNAAFDMRMTETFWRIPGFTLDWDFSAIHDTMIACHALRNLWRTNLKEARQVWLLFPERQQDVLRVATNRCRTIVKTKAFRAKYGEWCIANGSHPHFPAVRKAPKQGWWVYDTWLPAAVCRIAPEFAVKEPVGKYSVSCEFSKHPWEVVLKDYWMEDIVSTYHLWHTLREGLEQEGLWEQYLQRMEVFRVTYGMEQRGAHILNEIGPEQNNYDFAKRRAEFMLKTKAAEYGMDDFNYSSPHQLAELLYNKCGAVKTKTTDTGHPSTAAQILEDLIEYKHTPPEARFVCKHVIDARRAEKAWDYLEQYRLWSVEHGQHQVCRSHADHRTPADHTAHAGRRQEQRPVSGEDRDQVPRRRGTQLSKPKSVEHQPHHRTAGAHCIHGKPTNYGSDTVKQRRRAPLARAERFVHANYLITGTRWTRQSSNSPNLQNVGTGREDQEGELNYRLRVAFGPEKDRTWLAFDYSNLELRLWAFDCGNKELMESFDKGISIHMIIARELHPNLRKMSDEKAKETREYKTTKNGDFAIIYGSSPKTADATYGIPGAFDRIARRFPEVGTYTHRLQAEVERNGGWLETMTGYRLGIPSEDPHKAVSARIQGTAGNIIGGAMVDCEAILKPRQHLIIQVHDELIFDVPRTGHREIIPEIKRAMEKQGDKINIPLPVGCKIHEHNWAEGVEA